MKIINLTLLFLLGSSSLFAQGDEVTLPSEVKITKSDPYPVVDSRDKSYYSLGNGEVLSVKMKMKGGLTFVLQRFSGSNLNQEATKTAVITVEKGTAYEGIKRFGDVFYIMISKKTNENGVTLYAQQLNTESLEFVGTEKELFTMDNPENTVPFGAIVVSKMTLPRFSFDLSSDGSMMVVSYRKKPKIKDDSNNNDIIGMYAFDAEMNKVWGNEYEMPYTESLMDNLDFTVDSNGNGYFLIRKYKEEVTRKNRESADNQSLAILIAKSDGGLSEVEFSLGEYLIDGVFMKENKEGNIICAGYYRKPKSYGADGAFVSILDSKGSLEPPKFYEFSLDFIKKYKKISGRRQEKMEKADESGKLAMTNLEMRDIRVLEDGGIVLGGEIYYVNSTTDPKTGRTTYTYHYEDVVLVKINSNGELGWMEKFPKVSIRESYRMFVSAKYTYVLFLDPLRNASMTEDGQITNPVKGDYVTAHRVDNKTGERKYLPLFDWRKIDGSAVYQYALNRVIPLSDNSFAIELYIKHKSDQMFKVEFEE
jgi:hypothetical protein